VSGAGAMQKAKRVREATVVHSFNGSWSWFIRYWTTQTGKLNRYIDRAQRETAADTAMSKGLIGT
jgi:hypothetical protein